ncbi:MAG: hypothetical protein ABWZ77_07345 [Naasia sp.]
MKNRAIASVALAATLAIGLSGCNFFSPQRTLEKYDPSDGVGANLGDIDVRNAMLLTEDGTRATLVVSITNLTADAAQLEVEYASEAPDAVDGRVTFEIGVPAQSITTTSTVDSGQQIVLEDIDAPAGSLFTIFMQSGDDPGTELRVPVLDGTLEAYVPLLPSPSPTPTPTPTPVIEPSPIPTTTEGTVPEGTTEETSE